MQMGSLQSSGCRYNLDDSSDNFKLGASRWLRVVVVVVVPFGFSLL